MVNRSSFVFILIVIFIITTFPFFGERASAETISATVKISFCGDDFVDTDETCDGSELNGGTCTSQGFTGGTLSCTGSCAYNTSSCTSTPPPSGGGGGGGGGGIVQQTTAAVFKGKAYPSSDVTLLKGAQTVAITKAGPDANFEVRLSGLSTGTHTFGVWSEDSRGNRSITHTFTVSITSGVTTVISGIFLPPTISVDKVEVRRGEPLNILGQSVPFSTITILVNSEQELTKETTADISGAWLYQLDTLELDYGNHLAKSRAKKDEEITTFSNSIGFKVGTTNIATKLLQKRIKGDLNNDGRVNLIDFSIVAYWYKRLSPRANVDLNNDNKVDLIDFSIMAFYWTG